jgi:ADP-heptose:LPS heptosyltransferase
LLSLVALLRPNTLVSYRYPPIESTRTAPDLDFTDHILTRWSRLLAPLGVEPREEDLYRPFTPAPELCGFTVVHVGAGSVARLWPEERWAAVSYALERRGHRVVLTGSSAETDRVGRVRQMAELPTGRDRSGSADINLLAGLVAGARLVVCVDCGVSHLATAFRRPAVTLFGPIPPAWWGPPPGAQFHVTLWTGRYGDTYGDAPDPGLLEITVPQVLDAIDCAAS